MRLRWRVALLALAATIAVAFRHNVRRVRTASEPRREGATDGSRERRRDFGSMTKAELYEEAQRLNVPGRSRMSKDQLVRALAARSRA